MLQRIRGNQAEVLEAMSVHTDQLTQTKSRWTTGDPEWKLRDHACIYWPQAHVAECVLPMTKRNLPFHKRVTSTVYTQCHLLSLSHSLFTMKLEHRGRLSSWLHDRCRGSAPSRLLNHLNPNQKTSFGGAGLQANNSFSAWLACLRMLLVLTTFSVLCLCPLSNFRRLSYLSSTVRNVQWSQRPTVWFAG